MSFASVFLDFNLPNPTTWFYFSGLLAVALYFKFSRLLSIRNLDVLTLYLFAPGLLLLSEEGDNHFLGYAWLLAACLYFLVRCLWDLSLVRRPSLGPNLDQSGLAWMAGALFLSLVAVAAREPEHKPPDEPERKQTPTDKISVLGKRALEPYTPEGSERVMALLCHLSVVVGLVLIGWRHFDGLQAGMSAATFYLLLPYTFLLLPGSPLGVGRWDHAWPPALMVWAIYHYRRPMVAGAFLGVATGTAYFLVVCLPAWVSLYRDRGAVRFLCSFVLSAGLGLAALGTLLWMNGELPSPLRSDWTTFDWQPWQRPAPNTPGFWQDMPSARVARMPAAYRVPIFIASMALVIVAGLWPMPKNLGHVIALTAATLIAIQFWYADRGGSYVLWFLPLLVLMVFRPNLSAAEPPKPPSDDWPARIGDRLVRPIRAALRQLAPKRRRATPAEIEA